MIVFPKRWDEVGQKISLEDIDRVLLNALSMIRCNNLSFSGGLDSSLLLYYLTLIHGTDVNCYTIAKNGTHPDYICADRIAKHFGVNLNVFSPHCVKKPDDLPGDEIVRRFYECLEIHGVTDIISGDGIDEYMCGYYNHQKNPNEESFFDCIHRLKDEHLSPLDKNSGDIKVWLPYLDPDLLFLLLQIPIKEKVDSICRKKVMVRLAETKIPKEIVERQKYGFCDAMAGKD